MKGFIVRPLLVAGLLGGTLSSIGCLCQYRDVVDPCWPERYNAIARDEVVQVFGPQVQNGHILDQTIWPYHFETGTEKLTLGGQDKLNQLIRRRPSPDTRLFLATAHDLVFDAAKPEEYVSKRYDLDTKRIQTIQRYLAAQTAGRGLQFEVLVHNPSETGLNGVAASGVAIGYRTGFGAVLPTNITSSGNIGGGGAGTDMSGGAQGGGQPGGGQAGPPAGGGMPGGGMQGSGSAAPGGATQ